MDRYLITPKLRNKIKNSKYSVRQLNKILGFEIRNILNKNISIRGDHLQKISSLLNIHIKLKKIYLDYGKNLGKNAFTQPIKKVKYSKHLAEFIGIMLGDGNIWKNRVKIAFDKRNTPYIIYVRELFEKIFGIKLKREFVEETNNAYLYVSNRLIIEELFKDGLQRGDKIKNRLGIPVWIKQNKDYLKSCIKGLIDTDGCIYVCKREKQTYVKFTNFNERLLKDFKEATNALGYSFAKANKNNFCLYRKNEVANFIKDIKPLKSINGAIG